MDLDTGVRSVGRASIDGAIITLTTDELVVNRHYSVTILASNANDLATSYTTISMLAWFYKFEQS